VKLDVIHNVIEMNLGPNEKMSPNPVTEVSAEID
jgi:hypothetical protein